MVIRYQGDGRKMKLYDPSISPTESIMRQYRIPLTRENFLACGGYDGREPDAEEEQEIPLRFRLCESCWVYPCRCTIPGVAGFECECDPCAARNTTKDGKR